MIEEEKKTAPRRRRRRKKGGTLEDVRNQLSAALPSLIQSTTQCYEAFSNVEVPQDAKSFSAHHGACKAALSHVELLTKLARWAENTQEDGVVTLSEDEEIAGLLEGARAALKELEN